MAYGQPPWGSPGGCEVPLRPKPEGHHVQFQGPHGLQLWDREALDSGYTSPPGSHRAWHHQVTGTSRECVALCGHLDMLKRLRGAGISTILRSHSYRRQESVTTDTVPGGFPSQILGIPVGLSSVTFFLPTVVTLTLENARTRLSPTELSRLPCRHDVLHSRSAYRS